jgi:Asp-tRNA(Asn)/Glu-tRNA(Gln) amidotransferase A subunit family amidase
MVRIARECPRMEISQLSAVALADALRRRECSAVEALDATLERVEALAEPINPFALTLEQRARTAAVAADAALHRDEGGPLCGVPLTVKDSQWMAGVSAATGSRAMADFLPTQTTASVERLEAAGAVIFARTATPEFCYFGVTESPLNGVTANPWNLDRTAGGSSGGAAAAVSARLGSLSLGGDGGGSIRIPAAFCGVVGFKPTFGAVPREPSSAAWKTLIAYGPIARSVADVRLMLGVLAGADPRDRHSIEAEGLDAPMTELARVRLAVSEDLGGAPVDDDVRDAFRAAVANLIDAGAEIVEAAPDLPSSLETWFTIVTAEARWAEAEAFERRHELLGSAAAEFLAAGELITAAEYVRAQYERERIHGAYADLFARTGACALLTPTVGCVAFPHGRMHPETIGGLPVAPGGADWGGFLYDANLAGLPACALPMGLGRDGLPVSLQIEGPRRSDGQVLAVAEAIERVLGFVAQPPEPVPAALGTALTGEPVGS